MVAAGAAAAAARAGIVGARIVAQLGRLAQLALELRRIEFARGIYQMWVTSLEFAQQRPVGAVQGIVVKEVTDLDADWGLPAIELARIRW